jgi:hypothetical protein
MDKDDKIKVHNYSTNTDTSFPLNYSKNSTSVPLNKCENLLNKLNDSNKGTTEIEYKKLSQPKVNKYYMEDKIEIEHIDEDRKDDVFRQLTKRDKIV